MRFDRTTLMQTAGILAIPSLFFWLLACPQYLRMNELESQTASARQELKDGRNVLRAIAALEEELGDLEDEAAKFQGAIPDRKELGTFFQTLARFAQSHGLAPSQINPGSPVRSSGVGAIPVSFTVRGPFRAVHALIRDIEQMPRLTQFERFEVITGESEGSDSVLARVELRVFFRDS